MAMNGNNWGAAVKTAVDGVGITAGTPISDVQRENVFKAIKNADVVHITGNSVVTGTVTSGAGSGGAISGGVTS